MFLSVSFYFNIQAEGSDTLVSWCIKSNLPSLIDIFLVSSTFHIFI